MSARTLTAVLLLLAMTPLSQARAAMVIDITQGIEAALPIAVVPFGWEGKTPQPPESVGRIVAGDLRRSGQFAPLPDARLPGRPSRREDVDFRSWRAQGVDNLVIGRVREDAAGQYTVQFQLFDVLKGEQVSGYSFPAARAELRAVAHHIADIVFEKLTGVRGAFSARIAYIVAEGTGERRRYRLAISDSDGHGPQSILESSQPLMSPAWSPDAARLAYVSFENGVSEVYVQNVDTGRRRVVSASEGINGAPAWSPDGRRLALTLSKDGNPEIYVLDLMTARATRLTRSRSIDTEPAWSPDGNHIAFTSDRGGQPQIYRIAAAGGRAKRLTFEGDYNARPRYAPDGKEMVLVHGNRGRYRIAILDLETGNLRELTEGALDESPSYAPNGAMVLYASQYRNKGVLAGVSVDGRVKQRLRLERGEVREPAWSPFLP